MDSLWYNFCNKARRTRETCRKIHRKPSLVEMKVMEEEVNLVRNLLKHIS